MPKKFQPPGWFTSLVLLALAFLVSFGVYSGEKAMALLSFVLAGIGVGMAVIPNRLEIKVTTSRSDFIRAATRLYKSDDYPDSKIFSVIEHFDANPKYLGAFRYSKASEITVVGCAQAHDTSILGAICRLRIAREVINAKLQTFQVDYHLVEFKFVILEKDDNRREILVGEQRGRKTRLGIDLSNYPQLYAGLKRDFDALHMKSTPMAGYVDNLIIACYASLPAHGVENVEEFITVCFIANPKVVDDFKSQAGKEGWGLVVSYVEDVIRQSAPDKGRRLGVRP